jgi:hypothetical protein
VYNFRRGDYSKIHHDDDDDDDDDDYNDDYDDDEFKPRLLLFLVIIHRLQKQPNHSHLVRINSRNTYDKNKSSAQFLYMCHSIFILLLFTYISAETDESFTS